MMKKLAMAVLAFCAIATPTLAQESAPVRWTFQDLPFRNYRAANPAPGFVDSTYASGIAKFDTTVAISTDGWAVQQCASGAVDSVVTARLLIFDAGLADVSAGKTSATAESIYIKTQVSANGVAWHDAAIIPGQSPVINAFTVQTTVNAAVLTFTSSTNTSISDKLWSVMFHAMPSAVPLRSGQDIYHLSTFPFIRFIIMGSRSLNHSYRARLQFPSAAAR
jgi:hypothetical protein